MRKQRSKDIFLNTRNPVVFAFHNPHLGFQKCVGGMIGGFGDGGTVASGRARLESETTPSVPGRSRPADQLETSGSSL